MSAALKLDEDVTVLGARGTAVAKFRELADRLESGELAGARVQWGAHLDHIEVVELDKEAGQVRLYRVEV